MLKQTNCTLHSRLFVVLVGICLVQTAVAKICDFNKMWLDINCYGGCLERSNPHNELKKALDDRLVGQEHLKSDFLKMIKGRPAKNTVTSFLFAGDNGVGKTFTATLIKDVIYKDDSNFLPISGSAYIGDDQLTVRAHHKSLETKIVNQLLKCSNSFILFDDVQYIHVSTLEVILPFIDPQNSFYVSTEGLKVYTNEAIFGFVSDFIAPGMTEGRTFAEVRNMVYNETKRLWGEPKLAALIQNFFPFMPLTSNQMEELVKKKVLETTKVAFPHLNVTISRDATKTLVSLAQRDYNFEYGRGVYKYVQNNVIPELQAIEADTKQKRDVFIDAIGSKIKITHVPAVVQEKDEM